MVEREREREFGGKSPKSFSQRQLVKYPPSTFVILRQSVDLFRNQYLFNATPSLHYIPREPNFLNLFHCVFAFAYVTFTSSPTSSQTRAVTSVTNSSRTAPSCRTPSRPTFSAACSM